MEPGLMGTRLLVKNFTACFDFYTKKLELNVYYGDRKGPFASFCVDPDDGPCLAIFQAERMDMHKSYTPPTGTGHPDQAVLVIPTDDVDRDYRELKAKGIPFLGEPQRVEQWFMRCAYFRDPDGNLFELYEDDEE